MFSVVIPAHNEENVIGRCLEALFGKESKGDKEVIVVCNGCNDRTAEIARTFPGVQVIELEEASKIAALNEGDSAASLFPRVYLDADITCSLRDLERCIENMGEQHGIAAPTSHMRLEHSSWLVKAYFKTWMDLPYYKSGHMVGSGVFILTEDGRDRFKAWPKIIADDAFVRALFKFDEIYVDPESHFDIHAPRKLSGLIKIRTRARFGNIELESRFPELKVLGENSQGSLLKLLAQKPMHFLHWLTYVITQLIVIRNCKKKIKSNDFSRWERDDSARVRH